MPTKDQQEAQPEAPAEEPQPEGAPEATPEPEVPGSGQPETPQPEVPGAPQEATGELTTYGTTWDRVLEREVIALDGKRVSLKDITSMQDAIDAWGGQVLTADVLGDGFQLVRGRRGKDVLVGQTMVLADWRFVQGDFGVFVTCAAVTSDGRKVRFNDGSTGVCEQLLDFTQRTNKRGGLFLAHGLTRSDYEAEDANGNPVEASTYYLDTSA